MKIVKSKILNDYLVIVDNEPEYEEAVLKAKELDCALYTAREIEYITEVIKGMSEEDTKNNLILINKIKKTFHAFYVIPSDRSLT